ncbi:MAG: hypothetical protein KDD53_00845, partial [Bdellovibrionales bacterium]|nr:hypothetical protein [Bdellovibrionales bacterium]
MIIVSEKREPYTRHMLKVAKQSSRIGFWFTLLCLPVLLTVIVVSSIYYGAVLHRDQFAGNYEFNLHNLLSSWYMVPYNTLRAQFQDSKNLQIDLKHTDLQKLAYLRQRAFQEGFILDEFKQESVDAEISDGETSVKASIGLTGWFLDHLNTDKWSLRVRVRGDNAIFGMKKFNLLHPVTRQGIYEWIAHQFEKYEGLASLPYDFVDVTINGKNNGIYAIESSFDKYVMDKNKLREGFLFRIHPQFEVFEYDDVALNPVQRERIAYLKNIWGEFLAGKR